MLKNHTRLFSGEDNMSIVVREYDAKTDSKNRIRLQNPVFENYHVREMSDGIIVLSSSVKKTPTSVSRR